MTLATLFDTAQPVVVALMTEAEAISAEREIITTGNRLRVLLVDFYERRGWAALGYASWRGWASARLGQHEATAYRELTAGMVEREISPMGEIGQIPERQLRPLAPLRDDPDTLRETWDRANELAEEEGKPRTARHVTQAVAERTAPEPVEEPLTPYEAQIAATYTPDPPRANHQNINSSTNNEWYTPSAFVEAARVVLGGIDLDPASCPYANRTVQAGRFYTQDDDGITQPWHGTVWLNPPYGREEGEADSNQARWSRRLIDAYQSGEIRAAILLVNAVPGNKWFAPLKRFPICFPDARIRFYNESTEAGQPTHSNALIYVGPDVAAFVRAFSVFGQVMAPICVGNGGVEIEVDL
ncbi:MAG: DNA N-6-adenine-methyltransferase [Comamonadaceae bacterium]